MYLCVKFLSTPEIAVKLVSPHVGYSCKLRMVTGLVWEGLFSSCMQFTRYQSSIST